MLSEIMSLRGLKKLVMITIGSVVCAIGFMVFTVPFRFPDAGVTGMGILLNYATGFSIPMFVAIVNIVLLIWAWRELSPQFVFWTIVCVIVLTISLKLFEDMPKLDTTQLLLVSLIGGALKGYGAGLIINSGSSTGGTDIIVIYLQKKYGIEVGRYNFYINMCIIIAGIFIVGVENAMLGFAGVYADGIMTDRVLASFDKRRQVTIVTEDPKPIVDYISQKLRRGSTVSEARGGYSGATKQVVVSMMTRRQEVELRDYVAQNCPTAFMTVIEATEVTGNGFNPWRR